MLDKEMCKRFGVKPFMEWIQNELDRLEDLLYSSEIENSSDYAYIKIRFEALVEARNMYAQLHTEAN